MLLAYIVKYIPHHLFVLGVNVRYEGFPEQLGPCLILPCCLFFQEVQKGDFDLEYLIRKGGDYAFRTEL